MADFVVRKILTVLAACFTCVVFGSAAGAQTRDSARVSEITTEGVVGMTQVSARAGYVIVTGRLLWTSDNGTYWKDITPPGPADQSILSVFFLDAIHGWVVFVDGSGVWDSHVPVRLLRTEDGGMSWRHVQFDRSEFTGLQNIIAIPGTLWFSDVAHGWFEWRIATSAATSASVLFNTSDGGTTWAQLPAPPAGGLWRFSTSQDGWLVGFQDRHALYATHDGGQTWQSLSVPAPPNCRLCRPAYSPPAFDGPARGMVAASFTDQTVLTGRSVWSTYATENGGVSWLTSGTEERRGAEVPTAVLVQKDRIIRASAPRETGLLQIQSGRGIVNSALPGHLQPNGIVASTNFVDEQNGWIIYATNDCVKVRDPSTDGPGLRCLQATQRYDLLATTDGGKSFMIITPSAPKSYH